MENNEIKKETRSVKSAALEADEILRRAHEEAEKIVSAAKQQANAPQKCVPITQNANVPEEEIELFADSGNYSEPLAVKWGGRQFLIPRGAARPRPFSRGADHPHFPGAGSQGRRASFGVWNRPRRRCDRLEP